MDLASATFVVVDTETTGLRAEWDRVIEVAAVKVRGGEVVDRFQTLVNPGRSIPTRITYITGITTAMVFDQPPIEAVLPDFLDFLGDEVFAAHNLPFDHRFLCAELERCALPTLANPGVCTLRLARRLLPGLPSRGLGALGKHFGITNRARHRALGDAEVTASVLLRLIDRLGAGFGVTTLDELLGFQHRRYASTTGEPNHVRQIRSDVLPSLPERPGVYTFKRRNGEVLYVGKAKSLAHRVRSYFSAIDSHPVRIRKLVRDVRVVEWEETGTELGALLLESRLIKTLQPRDNRAQTEYRDYPFLRLDTTHPYPRLSVVRGIAADGAEYYGPINRRAIADEIVELVDQQLGLRRCDDPTWRTASAHERPCFYHEIDQCAAPCVAENRAQYSTELERVRRLLRGDGTEILDVLETRMHHAAERLDYEAAGRLRDRIRRVRQLTSNQRPFGRPIHDLDGILLEPDVRGGHQLFVIRAGRLVERIALDGSPDPAMLGALFARLVACFGDQRPPSAIYARSELDEIRILAHWLRCEGVDGRFLAWEPDVATSLAAMLGALATGGGDGAFEALPSLGPPATA